MNKEEIIKELSKLQIVISKLNKTLQNVKASKTLVSSWDDSEREAFEAVQNAVHHLKKYNNDGHGFITAEFYINDADLELSPPPESFSEQKLVETQELLDVYKLEFLTKINPKLSELLKESLLNKNQDLNLIDEEVFKNFTQEEIVTFFEIWQKWEKIADTYNHLMARVSNENSFSDTSKTRGLNAKIRKLTVEKEKLAAENSDLNALYEKERLAHQSTEKEKNSLASEKKHLTNLVDGLQTKIIPKLETKAEEEIEELKRKNTRLREDLLTKEDQYREKVEELEGVQRELAGKDEAMEKFAQQANTRIRLADEKDKNFRIKAQKAFEQFERNLVEKENEIHGLTVANIEYQSKEKEWVNFNNSSLSRRSSRDSLKGHSRRNSGVPCTPITPSGHPLTDFLVFTKIEASRQQDYFNFNSNRRNSSQSSSSRGGGEYSPVSPVIPFSPWSNSLSSSSKSLTGRQVLTKIAEWFFLDDEIEKKSNEDILELIKNEITQFYYELVDVEGFREEMFELDLQEGNLVRDLKKHYSQELKKGALSYWWLRLKNEKKKRDGINLVKDNISLNEKIRDLKLKVISAQEIIEYLKDKNIRQLLEKDDLQIAEEELRKKWQQTQEVLTDLIGELDNELIEKDNEFAEYREEVFAEAFAIQRTAENTIDELNTQKKALEDKLTVLESTLQAKERENAESQAESQRELSRVKSSAESDLEAEKLATQKEIELIIKGEEQLSAGLRKDYRQAKNENTQLKNSEQALSEEVIDLRNDFGLEREKWKEALAEATKENERLEDEVNGLERKFSGFQKLDCGQIDLLKEIRGLKGRIEELELELEETKIQRDCHWDALELGDEWNQRQIALILELRAKLSESFDQLAELNNQKSWGNYFSELATKGKNYLKESYQNHPTAYRAAGMGLAVAGTGLAGYYNWDSLAELAHYLGGYLSPSQVQEVIANLSPSFTTLSATTTVLSQKKRTSETFPAEDILDNSPTNEGARIMAEIVNGYKYEEEDNSPFPLSVDDELPGQAEINIAQVRRLEKKLKQFQRENEKLNQQVNITNEKLKKLEEELAARPTQTDYDQAKGKYEEANQLLGEAKKDIEGKDAELTKLKIKVSELEKRPTSRDFDNLNSTLGTTESKYKSEKNRANNLAQEKNKLTDKSAEQQKEIDSLKRQLTEALKDKEKNDEYQQENKKLNQQVNDLNGLLKDRVSQISDLEKRPTHQQLTEAVQAAITKSTLDMGQIKGDLTTWTRQFNGLTARQVHTQLKDLAKRPTQKQFDELKRERDNLRMHPTPQDLADIVQEEQAKYQDWQSPEEVVRKITAVQANTTALYQGWKSPSEIAEQVEVALAAKEREWVEVVLAEKEQEWKEQFASDLAEIKTKWKKEVDDMATQMRQTEGEISQERSKNGDLENKLNDAKSKNSDLASQLNNSKSAQKLQREDYEKKLVDLRKSLEMESSEREKKLSENISDFAQQVKELVATEKNQTKQIEDLNQEVKVNSDLVVKEQQKSEQLEEQLSAKEQELEQVKNDKEWSASVSRQERGKLAEKINSLSNDNWDLRTNLNRGIKNWKLDKEEFQQKIKDLTTQLANEQKAKEQTEANLKASQEKANKDKKQAQKSIADLKEAKKELGIKHNFLIGEYGSLSEAWKNFQIVAEQKEQKIADLSEQIKGIIKERDGRPTQSQYDNLKQERDELRKRPTQKKLDKVQKELVKEQEQQDQYLADIVNLEKQIKQGQKESKQLENKLNNANNNLVKQKKIYENKLDNLQKGIKNLRTSNIKTKNELNRKIKGLKLNEVANRTEFEQQIKDLENNKNSEINNLQEKITELQQTKTQAEKKWNKSLEKAQEEIKEQQATIKDKERSLQVQGGKLAEWEKDYQGLAEQLEKSLREVAKGDTKLQKEIAGLQKGWAGKGQATTSQPQKPTDASQGILAVFTLWLANRQGKINKQEEENKKLGKEKDKYQDKASDLKEKLKQSRQEKASLETQLTEQEKEIVQRINTDCQLGLEEVNLTKVIKRIKELMVKPDFSEKEKDKENLEKLKEAEKTIQELERELKGNDPNYTAVQQAEYQKILRLVKDDTFTTCEELGIRVPESIKDKIRKANTLEAVMKERNKLISAKLAENKNKLGITTQQKDKLMKEQNWERWIWVSLLMVSYLVIIGLVVKLKRRKRIK